MSRIRLLDEATVNQIAAGEVVERPASVVKELVENALDAGSTDIRIKVCDAGRGLIEVADDGIGMETEDLRLAFKQFATSKISDIDDLETLKTMGFRGEALSSVASVADIEIITRTGKSAIATRAILKAGVIIEQGEASRTRGTTVRATGLFAGLPARLKYLKSDRVEMGHIIEVVVERALARPDVAFRLHNDDVEVFNHPKGGMKERLTDVYGLRVSKVMVPIEGEGKGVKLTGYLAKPSVSRSTTKDLRIFVNGRPVSSRQVTEAVDTGYAGLLMRNRHPAGVLFIDIDPRSIDVNVHPTKREVKFQDIGTVARLVSGAVAAAMGNTDVIPDVEPRVREERSSTGLARPSVKPSKTEMAQTVLTEEEDGIVEQYSEERMLPRLKVIGQMLNTYILAQSGSDLVIIDQHAAHERVMLEKLAESEKKTKVAQKLITPVPLHLDKRDIEVLEHFRTIIEELGFTVEPFGADTYLVRAVPFIGGHLEAETGLLDLIHDLTELGRPKSIEERRDEIRHLVACHSAIRAGETLDMRGMRKLVEEMHGIDNPYTCAHGRPTLIRITEKELEKLFKRIV